MRAGYLCRSTSWLSGEQLAAMAAPLANSWAYVENEAADEGQYAVNLIFASALDNPAAYLHGRLFGSSVNMQWQSIEEDRFLVSLLTESTELDPSLSIFDMVHRCDVDDETPMFLWGTHVSMLRYGQYVHADASEPVWIETRIPRPLVYPVEDTPVNVKLIVRNYRIGGQIAATFWVRLAGADDE